MWLCTQPGRPSRGGCSKYQQKDVNRHIAQCTSPLYVVTLQCKLVSSWWLRKQISTTLWALWLWKDFAYSLVLLSVTFVHCASTSWLMLFGRYSRWGCLTLEGKRIFGSWTHSKICSCNIWIVISSMLPPGEYKWGYGWICDCRKQAWLWAQGDVYRSQPAECQPNSTQPTECQPRSTAQVKSSVSNCTVDDSFATTATTSSSVLGLCSSSLKRSVLRSRQEYEPMTNQDDDSNV